MRAWRYKALGPGSYRSPEDSLVLDEVGDIRLEANIEYRFSIYKFIKAAIFTDIGNVWLLRKDESRPGAEFDIQRFGRELAIDAGIGVRFDFNFFVLRVDWALPVYDPVKPVGSRWFDDMFKIKDNNRRNLLAIGIGYPF
jgi:outer membrane protein assembly factor BamA